MDLTDEQWAVLEPLIPTPPRRADGKGRPWRDRRDILNAILWIFLRIGAPWHDLPERYPPYQRAATAAFSSGYERARSRASSRCWPRTSKSAEGSISPIASSTRAPSLCGQKGRALRGKDQAGQVVVGSKLMAIADGSFCSSCPPHTHHRERVLLRTNSPLLESLSLSLSLSLSPLGSSRSVSFEASRRPGLRLRLRSMRHLEAAEGIEMIASA
jgi:hypothetical protein